MKNFNRYRPRQRIAWLLILVTSGIIFAFADGWMNNRSQTEQFLVWLLGGVAFTYGLDQLLPSSLKHWILKIGYIAVFAVLFSFLLTSFDKQQPKHIPDLLAPFEHFKAYKEVSSQVSLQPWLESLVERIHQYLGGESSPAEKLDSLIGETMQGRVVEVIDGDSLYLLIGRHRVEMRLHEIDAPEYDQPWGRQAQKALRSKINREQVSAFVSDIDRYGRYIVKIRRDDIDINRAMIREGHAWVYERYLEDRSLLKDQRQAKRQKVGIWSMDNPIEPWEWRRRRR